MKFQLFHFRIVSPVHHVKIKEYKISSNLVSQFNEPVLSVNNLTDIHPHTSNSHNKLLFNNKSQKKKHMFKYNFNL